MDWFDSEQVWDEIEKLEGETLEEKIADVLSVCEKLVRCKIPEHLKKALTDAMTEVYEFLPESEDPKEMGWVVTMGYPEGESIGQLTIKGCER